MDRRSSLALTWRKLCAARILVLLIFTSFVSGISAKAAGPVHQCTFEHAHYSLREHPDVEVGFTVHAQTNSVPGDLFVRIHVKSRDWTYWYFPDTGAGYTDIRLIPIENPQGQELGQLKLLGPKEAEQLTLFGLTKDLTFVSDYPKSQAMAPEMLFIPELGPLLFYDVRGIVTTRYRVPREFLVLDSCD
jgi:hypothetical protein